jgi:tryptophan-rich sensory protein
MTFRTVAAAAGIALVLIYAIGSSLWVNTGDNWYRDLAKPSWQPPSFIFGLIWPYNFVVIGIASVLIAQRATKVTTTIYLAFFALSVAAALIWAFQFYRPHNYLASAIALTAAALLTLPMTYIVATVSIPMAIAFAPYQLWVAIAASLSWGYWHLARLT